MRPAQPAGKLTHAPARSRDPSCQGMARQESPQGTEATAEAGGVQWDICLQPHMPEVHFPHGGNTGQVLGAGSVPEPLQKAPQSRGTK